MIHKSFCFMPCLTLTLVDSMIQASAHNLLSTLLALPSLLCSPVSDNGYTASLLCLRALHSHSLCQTFSLRRYLYRLRNLLTAVQFSGCVSNILWLFWHSLRSRRSTDLPASAARSELEPMSQARM